MNKLRSIFVLTIVFLLASFPVIADCDCRSEGITGIPQVECEALVAFYNSAGGPDWFYYVDGGEPPYYNRWNNTSPVENWFGVIVENGHVTGIDIPNYGLTPVRGTISPELGNLEFLEVFNIEYESLRGTLPAELGNLTQLKKFSLRSNQIEGSLPQELGNLVNLEEFSLQYNEVEGSIPPELGNLTSLRVLNFEGNKLTGSIPAELGNLENLEELDLGRNDLGGIIPPELGNLNSLLGLSLRGNRLEGSIPPVLGNLESLDWLALGKNQLEGNIPPELSNLTNLRVLKMAENRLEGTIPPALWNMVNLTSLHLGENFLEGKIPPEIGNLTSLVNLDLSFNHMSGSIPPEIGNLINLEVLRLNSNELEGELPYAIGTLTELGILELSSNKLSGPLPDNIINLQFLNPPFMGTHTSTSRVRFNAFYSTDPEVQAYMDDTFSGWSFSQTDRAEDLRAQVLMPPPMSGQYEESNRIKLIWDPIVFQEYSGGYEACIKESVDGPCVASLGVTDSKEDTSLVVSGLKPNSEYLLDLVTKTYANERNQNTVTSRGSGAVTVLTGPEVLTAFPLWDSQPGFFTGMAFSNYGEVDTEVSLTAWTENGQKQSMPVNPSQFNVGAGKQYARLGREFFGVGESYEGLSWVEVSSDQLMGSFFTFGSIDMDMLDGAVTQSRPSRKLYFTTPLESGVLPKYGETENVNIALINPFDDSARLTLTLIQRDSIVDQIQREIPGKGILYSTGEELFPSAYVKDLCFLQVETTSGPGVIGFARADYPESGTTYGMNAFAPSSAETLYSAQLASGPGAGGSGMETHIRLLNTTDETRVVTFKAVAEDGTLLAEPKVYRILNRRIAKERAWTLFDFEGDAAIGSLVIEVDSGGVVGDVIFTPFEGMEYAAAMPLQTRPVKEAVFNHIANSDEIYTGLAFFNPGEETAEITIVAKHGDGTEAGVKQISLAPGHRISRTLHDPDMMPGTASQLDGFISISSTQPIICQQLFGSTDLRFLAAVPPTTSYTGMF